MSKVTMPINSLIPILSAIERTRPRREKDPENTTGWYIANFHSSAACPEPIRYMHLWIDKHTTGRFYLIPNQVAFQDEKDYVTFKMGFGNQVGFET